MLNKQTQTVDKGLCKLGFRCRFKTLHYMLCGTKLGEQKASEIDGLSEVPGTRWKDMECWELGSVFESQWLVNEIKKYILNVRRHIGQRDVTHPSSTLT
jgi:hypothetical protein